MNRTQQQTKEITDILLRNNEPFYAFVDSVKAIEIGTSEKTIQEFLEIMDSAFDTDESLDYYNEHANDLGLRSLDIFHQLVITCLQEMARGEKRSDMSPEEGELMENWLMRISKNKKADIWEGVYEELVIIFQYNHDNKVREMRQNYAK